MGHTRSLAVLVILFFATASTAYSQNKVEVSGLFYMDYEYVAESPDSASVGENGFQYRRLHLTADYDISETFSGRARLEAQSSKLTSGSPYAFVKDLWLKWKDMIGEGHHGVFGVQSPPSFVVSEKIWGYRSLERTIMDRNAAVSSRDFGVQLTGEFGDGGLGYGLMFGNNSSVIGETNKGKRLYGQLQWMPGDRVTLTAGGDYATKVPFVEEGLEANRANFNGFASYHTATFRVGVEGYYRTTQYKNVTRDDYAAGISVWAVSEVGEKVELIARVDRVDREIDAEELGETFVLAGVALKPHDNVQFIPNLVYSGFDEAENPTIAGRVTLHADF